MTQILTLTGTLKHGERTFLRSNPCELERGETRSAQIRNEWERPAEWWKAASTPGNPKPAPHHEALRERIRLWSFATSRYRALLPEGGIIWGDCPELHLAIGRGEEVQVQIEALFPEDDGLAVVMYVSVDEVRGR